MRQNGRVLIAGQVMAYPYCCYFDGALEMKKTAQMSGTGLLKTGDRSTSVTYVIDFFEGATRRAEGTVQGDGGELYYAWGHHGTTLTLSNGRVANVEVLTFSPPNSATISLSEDIRSEDG